MMEEESQEHGYSYRQMTRVSKTPKFSEQKRFAKRRKRIGFSKFQLLFGSFLDAIYEFAVENFFVFHF